MMRASIPLAGVFALAFVILLIIGSPVSSLSYQYSLCNDTDGGQNYSVKGNIIRLGEIAWPDTCLNPSQLQEGYCEVNARMGWKVVTYDCPYGCYKGACQPPLNAKVYISTTTTSSTTTSLRSTSTTIWWYTSTSTLPSQKTTTTMAATTTLQGSAASQASITPQIVELAANIRCIDSDGGINYGLKGFILKNTTMTSTQIWYDTCLNPSQLQEGYCDKSRKTGERVLIYSCPLGCYLGACKQGPSTTTTTTTTSTTTLKTGCVQDSDCVRCGDKCISLTANELAAIQCLSSPLAGCRCIGGVCVPVAITTTTTATTTTTLETTSTTLPSGQTTTSTTTTTTIAAVVPQVVTLYGTMTCIDSDGGLNYYLKGHIYLNSTYTSKQAWYDYCLSPSILQEAYCDKAKRAGYRPVTYNCLNGCEDGACKVAKIPSSSIWQTTSTTQPQ